MSAGYSADGAEMAQVQRITPLCPPRRRFCVVVADTREQSAENANANVFLTQSHEGSETQRS